MILYGYVIPENIQLIMKSEFGLKIILDVTNDFDKMSTHIIKYEIR